MGTELYAAIQHFRPRGEFNRDGWSTVAQFELNKDYALSHKLYDSKACVHAVRIAPGIYKPDEHWPDKANDQTGYQCFSFDELPLCSEVPESLYYAALHAAATRLVQEPNEQYRMLFWRDS